MARAHRDIAFEFGSWLSPEFKLYLIKEFRRLKDEEAARTTREWSFQRTLAKVNSAAGCSGAMSSPLMQS